jgi:branched-chain amino acid transport system substrate-binding protein
MVGEVYTGLGQLDFAAEIAQIKSAKPDAVAVFYPASFGVNFTKQYGQSGLIKEIPLYSAFSIDETALPAIGDVAIGTFQTGSWNFDKPNPANVKFREDFIKEYKYRPTFVAAYAYDAARLLNAALTEVHGNLADKPALIAALDKANFASVRGKFKYAADHFPIQDFDLLEVEKAKDGTLVQVTRSTVLHDHSNAYVSQCQMPAP